MYDSIQQTPSMFHRDDWASLVGVGVLLGLGWILVALNTVRAIQSDASLTSRFVGITIPFALGVVLFAGALAITLYGLTDQTFLIATWTVAGTLSVTVAIVSNILAFDSVQPDFALALFMVVNAAGGGAAFGFLVGLYDAHQHRLKREWKVESERATALSQRLSVVNRVLRHDIRNQAQIVTGAADRWEPTSPEQARLRDQVERSGDRLAELSTEAREMETLFSGTGLDREVLDLPALVREAGAAVVDSRTSFVVEYDLPDEQPVFASPLLRQAVEHVLSNAAEHNDSATPRATVTVRTVESSDSPVRVTVTDNGPGIPESERLAHGDVEESPLHHSAGVGLWFVTWVVEDSDGSVTVETDTDDVGSRVTLALPLPPG